MIKANGIPSLTALNILNVYSVRSNVAYPFLMVYLVNWQAKVINPFLITMSYLNRNRKMLFLSVFLQLLLYLITAYKTFLLIPVAIIFIIEMIKKFDFLKTSSKVSVFAVLGMYISYLVTQSIVIPSLFIRRFLFVPALIKFYYYDFFSNHGFMYFSAGTLGNILGVKYNYDLSPAYLIGQIYFNNPQTGANTGYIGDAYANMGFVGMIIISVLFIWILKLIDSLSIKIGKNLTVGLALFSILSLNDSALLTTLLTGGLLLLLCILYLYTTTNFSTD
jgi:hypothetical protein